MSSLPLPVPASGGTPQPPRDPSYYASLLHDAGDEPALQSYIIWSIENGNLGDNYQIACQVAGMQPGQGLLTQAGPGIESGASSGASAALGALGVGGLVTGVATFGIGAAFTALFAIFQHHAIAVKNENAAECTYVPQINNQFAQIDQQFASGALTLQQAIQALQNLCNAASAAFASVAQPNPCNVGCELVKKTKAIAMYRIDLYTYQASKSGGGISGGAIGPLAVGGLGFAAWKAGLVG